METIGMDCCSALCGTPHKANAAVATRMWQVLGLSAVTLDPGVETLGTDTKPHGHLGHWTPPVAHLLDRFDLELLGETLLPLLRFHLK